MATHSTNRHHDDLPLLSDKLFRISSSLLWSTGSWGFSMERAGWRGLAPGPTRPPSEAAMEVGRPWRREEDREVGMLRPGGRPWSAWSPGGRPRPAPGGRPGRPGGPETREARLAC